MNYSLDLEIFRRLKEGVSQAKICEDLVFSFSKSGHDWDTENLNTFFTFLLKSGQNDLLINFCIDQAIKNKNFVFPWGHFLEVLFQAQTDMDDKLSSLLKKTMKVSRFQYEASRCFRWDFIFADVDQWRSQKKWELGKRAPLLRKEMLEELNLLRAQQLIDAETKHLQKMKKMFPQDPEIEKEIQGTRERKAYDVLSKYEGLQIFQIKERQEEELQDSKNVFFESLLSAQRKDPSVTMDLAMVCWMIDDYEGARILLENYMEPTDTAIWFKMEVLLKSRRYLDVLNELPQIELKGANNPETFFATALLRAQSYWGLGQKNKAIEILESLLASRPHYRSAPLLLNQWRGL